MGKKSGCHVLPYSGNENLKPEENTSFETGVEYNKTDWKLSATYFYRNENPSRHQLLVLSTFHSQPLVQML